MTEPVTQSDLPAALPTPAEPDSLAAALTRHNLSVTSEQAAKLERYCRLLWDWNEKINLTRHTDWEKFVSRDLVDSIQLAALLHPGEEVLDVGSGGGVPGIPLAILRPDLQVVLCDSVQKKVRVLQDIVQKLDLPIAVHPERAEEVLRDTRFDAVTARAVGPLADLLRWFEPHWACMGRLLAIKGPKWPEELKESKRRGQFRTLQLKTAAEYPMAGTESNSYILKIWPQGGREK